MGCTEYLGVQRILKALLDPDLVEKRHLERDEKGKKIIQNIIEENYEGNK